jgi:hypothetical protein
VGNVRFSAKCTDDEFGISLFVYVRNQTSQTGTVNSLLTERTFDNDPHSVFVSGEAIAAGAKRSVDRFDTSANSALISVIGSALARTEGHTVFQTPGQVTTLVFHSALLQGSRCEFFGTAVTATSS